MVNAIRRIAPIGVAILFGMSIGGIAAADQTPAAAPASSSMPTANAPAAKMEKKADAKKAKHEAFVAWVKKAQQALNANGAKLEINGKLDKETRVAIRNFQKKNGLKETGHINRATRSKLKV